MLSKPIESAEITSLQYYTQPVISSLGFREYDGRWKLPKQLNLLGMQALGLGFGTQIRNMDIKPRVVVGHDYRKYSESVKMAFMLGLIASGCQVLDIGLSISPMAYFAQFDLDAPAIAMITASHNPNDWTGAKLGANRPMTHGPEDMKELKDIVLAGHWKVREGGTWTTIEGEADRYIADLVKGRRINRKLRVVCACGNGGAAAFAPKALAMIGVEVIPLHAILDHTFPNYNPNPEAEDMLMSMVDAVREHDADCAFGFDGDGDRCGFVDNKGNIIYPDKMGVILAREWAAQYPNARFVADVKSTSLFTSDPQLLALGAKTDYCKTGHSYMKRYLNEHDCLAGFERSGHYVFAPPLGRGYDDGIATALEVCRLLDRYPEKTLSNFFETLDKTWGNIPILPLCSDKVKYEIIEKITDNLEKMAEKVEPFAGRRIESISKINGIRVQFQDGAWVLIRASSNMPNLVVICESPNSSNEMTSILGFVKNLLSTYPEIDISAF